MIIEEKLLSFHNKLIELKKMQEEIENESNNLINTYIKEDISVKYEELVSEYAKLEEKNQKIENELKTEKMEKKELKSIITEMAMEEKRRIVINEKNKVENYLSSSEIRGINKLKKIEKDLAEEINHIEIINNKETSKLQDLMGTKIHNLKKELEETILETRNNNKNVFERNKIEIERIYEEIEKEPLENEKIEKRIKENRFELLLGLNFLNKIGIILILLGVVTAFKFTYSNWFNEYAKGITFYLLGTILIGIGEHYSKGKRKVFSLGLTGGAIGVFYASTFFSYFSLNIISIWTALFIAILITLSSIYLAIRYNSKTISIISLIGGYLPVISLITIKNHEFSWILSASCYVILLNLMVLSISTKKKWNLVSYISYILHFPYLVYLAIGIEKFNFSLFYVNFIFVIYLGVILIYPLLYKERLRIVDMILLGFNTLISFLFSYELFNRLELNSIKGILPVIYGGIYFVVAKSFEKSNKTNNIEKLLYYSITLTFSIIVMPIQLGLRWAILGWLAEGGALVYLGLKKKEKKLFYAGSIVFGLGQIYFYIAELGLNYSKSRDFQILYFIVVSTLAIYYYAVYKNYVIEKIREKKELESLKNILVVVCSIYLFLISDVICSFQKLGIINTNLRLIVTSIFIFLYTWLITKTEGLQSDFTLKYSKILNFIGAVCPLFIENAVRDSEIGTFVKILYFVILVFYNILCLQYIKEFTKKIAYKNFKSIDLYPVIFSLIVLGYSTSFISVQLGMETISLYFSIFILLYSLINLSIGFIYAYRYLRYGSLALTLITLTKTFIFDINYVTAGSKIIAFFTYGIILLTISYLYQRLSGKFEVKLKNE